MAINTTLRVTIAALLLLQSTIFAYNSIGARSIACPSPKHLLYIATKRALLDDFSPTSHFSLSLSLTWRFSLISLAVLHLSSPFLPSCCISLVSSSASCLVLQLSPLVMSMSILLFTASTSSLAFFFLSFPSLPITTSKLSFW
eukprot:TRINITY_DN2266_c0_g1_i1.p1 TRINITY_DN2266_c0_g1~~TRINITY_DN2266_c0_g1_i1.p1  ORF type:complete len:143 (-),score=20.53 TRINITY_DN2266_c0_g1_i1:233-661(-)